MESIEFNPQLEKGSTMDECKIERYEEEKNDVDESWRSEIRGLCMFVVIAFGLVALMVCGDGFYCSLTGQLDAYFLKTAEIACALPAFFAFFVVMASFVVGVTLLWAMLSAREFSVLAAGIVLASFLLCGVSLWFLLGVYPGVYEGLFPVSA